MPPQVPWGGQLCRDTLAYPGSAAVIRRLHRGLSQFTATAAAPFSFAHPGAAAYTSSSSAVAAGSSSPSTPLQQCCAINAWTLLICGLVVPLYITYHSERSSRCVCVCGGGGGGRGGGGGHVGVCGTCSVLCTFVLRLLLPKLYGGGWNLSAGASLLAPRAAFDHAMLAVRMAPPALLYLPKCTAHLCPC